jgi:hypothetical protein
VRQSKHLLGSTICKVSRFLLGAERSCRAEGKGLRKSDYSKNEAAKAVNAALGENFEDRLKNALEILRATLSKTDNARPPIKDT